MSSQENIINAIKPEKYYQHPENNANSSIPNKPQEEKAENGQIIKPVPVSRKVIMKSKSELTAIGESTLTTKNVVKEINMPLMYNNYNFPNRIQNGLYIEDLNYKNNLESKHKEENNSFSFKKDKPCCSCTKTKCIKKYCECFANNKLCIDCHCQNCMNKSQNYNYTQKSSINISGEVNDLDETICTCSKSNCSKKYCECYKLGKKCTNKCRCINCMNLDKNNNLTYNKINTVNNLINDIAYKDKDNNNKEQIIPEEKKIIMSKSSENENIDNSFKIQRISVFINKYQTLINVEKLNKEDLNLLCKKRKHC